jgi:glycerol-3-phosphate acyltransferase PlsX
MHESATNALKRKDSTIYKAVDLVKDSKADAVVSAGHSGATMSLSTLRLGRLKGVLRPAIATLMPTEDGRRSLVLDVGANTDCKSEHLFQFAIMGSIYSQSILGIENPRVALLSNGSEKKKGNKLTHETWELLEKSDMNFVGYVEGNTIFEDVADVIICDGFVGNIVLKVCEGFAGRVLSMVKGEMVECGVSPKDIGKILMGVSRKLDYSEYGGAPLLGVDGNCIISHGSSKAKAIKNAIILASKMVKNDLTGLVKKEIERYS